MKSCSPLYFQLHLRILFNLKKIIKSYQVPKIEPCRNLNSDPYHVYQRLSSIFGTERPLALECVIKIIFLFLNQNICCRYSKELSQ